MACLARLFVSLLLLALAGCTAPAPRVSVQDSLSAVIDLSDQQVTVTRSHAAIGVTETWVWPVSTGRPGFRTPMGVFHPVFLSRYHRSTLYEDAPMPWSVFFYRGIAIHGTDQIRWLGLPVSHGCVRLHPVYAEIFFKQVLEVGKANTVISVVQ